MKKYSIRNCHEWAVRHDGYCLSESYIGMRVKLKWKCKEGHIWEAEPRHIKDGKWCKECSINKKRLSINQIKQRIPKGGKLLSTRYINAKTKLHWKCNCGHEWYSVWSNVSQGKWCPKCAGNSKRTLQEFKEIARSRGGKCISNKYLSMKKQLIWQCHRGHQWKSTPEKISIGRWCPYCHDSSGESICRVFFEQLYNKNFPKSRPSWLINSDGNRMELDGYCEELGIAFEHHGDQHFKITKFTPNKKSLQKRINDDQTKRDLCKKYGVKLIEIPQIFSQIEINSLKDFIKKFINIPEDFVFNLDSFYRGQDKIEEFRKIAQYHGGNILSSSYINSKVKLKVQCKCGRVWMAWPDSLKQGHWCASCSMKGKK